MEFEPSESEGLWSRFVRWTQRNTGYPEEVDFCNCGADIGYQIPQPELIKRPGMEPKSLNYRQQLYGAALYWHLATVPGEKIRYADPDLLRGKDVLEVGCMRGGGARYLAEVSGPSRYVATDYLEENVEICRTRHTPLDNLEFQQVNACDVGDNFPAESFDFVLCVQGPTHFEDMRKFVFGASQVLRPGGRILMCDTFKREKLQAMLDAIEEFGMVADATVDISRAVHAVGICRIPAGLSYLRLVARKP
jgi:2-polyprenyl-3-methyl-5-hydroxy-6-metoxy-1,4-benzoquinol methylase